MKQPDVVLDNGNIRLYCGDCLEILPTLEAVDAVIADPPYGVNAVKAGKCFGKGNACKANDYRPIAGDDRPFDPFPLLSVGKTVCLWGANHYSARLPSAACWLVWDKRDGCNSNPLADCELAWTNKTTPARLFHHRWMGMIRASEREKRVHPAQKPVALMEWCIEQVAVPDGGVVLDPYMGSGPTGVACVKTGRKFIGIELDRGYFDIAVKRIEKALKERDEQLIGANDAAA